MMAFAWLWNDSGDPRPDLSARLAASLCAGIGGHVSNANEGGLHFAYRPPHHRFGLLARWRPATLPTGATAVFHGYFDNAADVAAAIDADQTDPATLYGLAVERWGDETEKRVVGEYCAIIVQPEQARVRLARSPLRAPPLCYHHGDELVAAASVPRALFSAGVEQRLNERHVADSALINFTDPEPSWFEDVFRVPIGSVVELERGRPRQMRKVYDLLAVPNVRLTKQTDYVERAAELLDEGVRACMAGFRRPGATLSGGLDSPQVAVRALASLPEGQPLPTFTFHPEESFDGRVERWKYGDDRPFVEAFCAMHPGLEPHFTTNQGYGHDYRWSDFFHLMGGAPSGLCNMYVFHGLCAEAAKQGCDVLLLAEWGNLTFSDKGDYGFVEYLFKGRWLQLWRALTRQATDDRSIAGRFVARCLQPLLPDPFWRWLKRTLEPSKRSLVDLMQPLSPAYRASSGADDRLRASGLLYERYHPRTRRHALALQLQNEDSETAEIYQAFEQMYGVAQRDPTAYRPFVEFCVGLPTEMFLRDGTRRWLARELAKGVMPDAQRTNLLNGRWDADWSLRIKRQRDEYLAELERLSRDPRMAAMLDLPRFREALNNLPDQTELDPQKFFSVGLGLPRALLTARFINWVEGRNQP